MTSHIHELPQRPSRDVPLHPDGMLFLAELMLTLDHRMTAAEACGEEKSVPELPLQHVPAAEVVDLALRRQ